MAGMKATLEAAEQGMALFAKEEELQFDTEGASAYKQQHDALIKEKEDMAAALTGKDNKKARNAKAKEVANMPEDACYVPCLARLLDDHPDLFDAFLQDLPLLISDTKAALLSAGAVIAKKRVDGKNRRSTNCTCCSLRSRCDMPGGDVHLRRWGTGVCFGDCPREGCRDLRRLD